MAKQPAWAEAQDAAKPDAAGLVAQDLEQYQADDGSDDDEREHSAR